MCRGRIDEACTRARGILVDDTNDANAQRWEAGQVYAPYLVPTPHGTMLADFYNAGSAAGNEQSGAAYLLGGADALPGYDFVSGASKWARSPANPTLPNDPVATFQVRVRAVPAGLVTCILCVVVLLSSSTTVFVVDLLECVSSHHASTPAAQASDPKVFWDAEQHAWVLFYFCNGAGTRGGAAICVAFSDDQAVWLKASEPLYFRGGHPRGYDSSHAHKVWLTSDGAVERALARPHVPVLRRWCLDVRTNSDRVLHTSRKFIWFDLI